jgi:hypothetical protein
MRSMPYNVELSLHGHWVIVFITATECVYCAVRAESLDIIQDTGS